MQERNELEEQQNPFELLPNELIATIGTHVDGNKRQLEYSNNFVLTNSLFYNTYQQERLRYQRERLKPILIEAVTAGDQDKAQKILQRYPELLLTRGIIKDQSKRIFKNISVWEYTLWALDVRYMAPMMLNCLPHNEQGEAIRLELVKQFDEVETKGVTYELEGVVYHEKHYDFAIIEALKDYAVNETEKCWCTKVGQAQRLVPAHVAQHYCDLEESFYPTPTFKKEEFTRTLNFQLNHHEINQKWETWFSSSGLGINFAILRAYYHYAISFKMAFVAYDLAAMTTLRDVRIEDLALLKQQLQKPLHQHDVEPDSERMQCF
ncbi:SidC homolog [Legionella lansingensis]|uniref:SidC homolog n=1 Tax=Legionella lansingensis TaxID=45067 RepID=A0A0W0VGU0_9GAMM|nr:hypothetical protein [Legionella lansingensis]KTD19290.1 hypothetical protein Llan_2142 [Legionella lansingensis]SNV50493.1 SidC homolog [Legionella lansingensis]